MAPADDLSPAQRIVHLLRHLGIERAHFGAQITTELAPILAAQPEMVASLTLIAPNRIDPVALAPLASRLLLFSGDRGVQADAVRRAKPGLGEATLVEFPDYFAATWSDVAADHTASIADAMLDLLARSGAEQEISQAHAAGDAGEVAGISYQVEGSGPAVVLLPLLLAPSQWQPLLARLRQLYGVVTLGGPMLGMVATLEDRGTAEGYLRVVQSVLDAVRLKSGETVLDVGCGTGAIDRWLARQTDRANPITAVDHNSFFLREARALAAKDGLDRVIDFREGNAEALPFPAASFDVTMSHTVMEECDADRMLAEMIRVTRPGGRVAVMVRAVDMPALWNLPLPEEIKAKVQAPVRSVGEQGCADVSLYRRFQQSGLVDVKMFPHVMTNDRPDGPMWQYYESHVLSLLTEEQARHWRDAKAKALAEGTLFFARMHHCAVGTQPG